MALQYTDEDPDQLLANPSNFRVHPTRQQRAVEAILHEIGYVAHVLVNQRTGHIIDGHLRTTLALRAEEISIPVAVVDLSLEDEQLLLATFDSYGLSTVFDQEVLKELLRQVQTEDATITGLLAQLAERADLYPQEEVSKRGGKTDPTSGEEKAPPEPVSCTCPNCGHTYMEL
jgi:hypothetical protein